MSHWIDRAAVFPNFEMQHYPVAAVTSHFRNFLAGIHPVIFLDQAFTVMGIGTQESVIVLNNDQFTIADQAVAAIDHRTCCRGLDGLALSTTNIETGTGRITGFESLYDLASGWPLPGDCARG